MTKPKRTDPPSEYASFVETLNASDTAKHILVFIDAVRTMGHAALEAGDDPADVLDRNLDCLIGYALANLALDLRERIEAVLLDANVTYGIILDGDDTTPMMVERQAIVKALGYADESAWLDRTAEINAERRSS